MAEGKIRLSPEGEVAFLQMQTIYGDNNLTASDGVALAGDLMVWAISLAFREKQDALDQVNMMVPGILASIEANWPHLAAVRKALEESDAAEPGRYLQ